MYIGKHEKGSREEIDQMGTEDINFDFQGAGISEEVLACEELNLEPTNVLPGSREKVEVLILRYEHGLPLWHPEDMQEVGVVELPFQTSIESSLEFSTTTYGVPAELRTRTLAP